MCRWIVVKSQVYLLMKGDMHMDYEEKPQVPEEPQEISLEEPEEISTEESQEVMLEESEETPEESEDS